MANRKAVIKALESALASAINKALSEQPPDLIRRVGELLVLAADGAGEAGEVHEELPALRELHAKTQRTLDAAQIKASRRNSAAAASPLPAALAAFTPLAKVAQIQGEPPSLMCTPPRAACWCRPLRGHNRSDPI